MTGKVRATSGALVHSAQALARRLAQQARRYQTGGPNRARIPGPVRFVSEISDEQIVDGVFDIVRTQLPRIRVHAAGTLLRADRALAGLDRPQDFFADGVQAQLDHVRTFGLAPAAARRLVAGNDRLTKHKRLISADERIRRIAEAQLAAAAEMLTSTGELTPLYSTLLSTMVGFTRGFVNRYGYEHGLRFELRYADVMSRFPSRSGLATVHQVRGPLLYGSDLAASFDSLLYGTQYAIGGQYKAYSLPDTLALGRVNLVRDSSGQVKKVTGPNMVKQAVSDALRWKRTGFMVPGPNAAPFTSIPPTNLTGWHPLGETTLYICDTQFVGNQIIETVLEAFRRTGRTRIDLGTDLATTPERAQLIRDVFAGHGSILRLDMHELEMWADIEDYYTARLPVLEEFANSELARPDVAAAIGRDTDVYLIGSHEPERLEAFLRTHEVIW
ncbi:hypothetical protein [Micromonospora sp. NPDC126480]|uniref:hypothetical protein n=1 Tax=Micromonospora sp. NPDC126480 TaxID=3155312 RepID=UPI003329E74F